MCHYQHALCASSIDWFRIVTQFGYVLYSEAEHFNRLI